MENTPRDSHERKARQYLDGIGDAYVLNESGTIYQPKTHNTQDERNQNSTNAVVQPRPPTGNIRKWLSLVIAGLTLFLLGATVHYTRKQWLAMNETLGEIRKQSPEISKSADAAKRAADAAIALNIPYLTLEDFSFGGIDPNPAAGSDQNWQMKIRNYGKTPAFISYLSFNVFVGQNLADIKSGETIQLVSDRDPVTLNAAAEGPNFIWKHNDAAGKLFAQDKVDKIRSGKFHLWLFAVVKYRDFSQNAYERGFCLLYDPKTNLYSIDNRPEYNFLRWE